MVKLCQLELPVKTREALNQLPIHLLQTVTSLKQNSLAKPFGGDLTILFANLNTDGLSAFQLGSDEGGSGVHEWIKDCDWGGN